MQLSEYLKKSKRGTLSQLANILDVPPSSVSDWASKKRPIPIEYTLSIEQFTNGEVTRQELQPEKWEKIWPELAEK